MNSNTYKTLTVKSLTVKTLTVKTLTVKTLTVKTLTVGMLLLAMLAIGDVSAIAQTVQAQQTIEGFVTDEAGKPMGCKIYIYTPGGKKIQINSNSKDGSYLQTLSEAGAHKFVFLDYNVYRKEEMVDIAATQKFKALKRSFTVQTIIENAPIFSVRGFDRNSANLTSDAKRKLAEAGELMRANQQMRMVFVAMPDEDQLTPIKAKNEVEHQKAMEAWKKAVKKVKKGKPLPPEPERTPDPVDPNVSLMQSRLAAVKAEIKDIKSADERVTFDIAAAPSMATQAPAVVEPVTKGKKKASKKTAAVKPVVVATTSHATLVAKIGKVKRLFDQ